MSIIKVLIPWYLVGQSIASLYTISWSLVSFKEFLANPLCIVRRRNEWRAHASWPWAGLAASWCWRHLQDCYIVLPLSPWHCTHPTPTLPPPVVGSADAFQTEVTLFHFLKFLVFTWKKVNNTACESQKLAFWNSLLPSRGHLSSVLAISWDLKDALFHEQLPQQAKHSSSCL